MTAFLEYTVDGEVLTQEFTCLEDASEVARTLDSWDRIYEVIDGEQVVRTTPQVITPPPVHPANG
jgi:hypothetical protein|tara:strand:+ start:933 stop:1127 length:195 start_codon:yes stop_codon:yes gene_type:complete